MKNLINYLYLRSPRKLNKVLFYLLSLFFKGSTFTCTVCSFNGRKKLKLHFGSVCPRCTSLPRDELLFKVIETLPKNVLELVIHSAPEMCFLMYPITKQRHIINIGFNRPDIQTSEDLQSLSFSEKSCTLFIAQHVLEHIPNDLTAISEIYRVLRPGCFALLSVPLKKGATFEDPNITDPVQRKLHFGQEDHLRYYGMDIVQKLKDAGFKVSVYVKSNLKGNKNIEQIKTNSEYPNQDVLFLCERPIINPNG